MTIEEIRTLCDKKAVRWTFHVVQRLIQRDIRQEDVLFSIRSGEIIEQYLNDYPYPSCLILGINTMSKFMHIVCGTNGIELWVITAYYPNPSEWSDDFKTRKELSK